MVHTLKSDKEIIEIAKRTFRLESQAILGIGARLGGDFALCIRELSNVKGRTIVTGIGKSAIIAEKMVATFNSTGTPAIFMHASDAIHGDLGIIQKDDAIIVLSKSGNTPEIKALIPFLKKSGNLLVAITGNTDSYLSAQSEFVLDCAVEMEACPHNLAPTSSATAQLVMGDTLAICLLEMRNFTEDDFARFHPGGILGKMLYLRISEMASHNAKPQVKPNDNLKKVILEISSGRLGAVAVIDSGNLVGVITDGDLRRMMEKTESLQYIMAKDIMNKSPKTVNENVLAAEAIKILEENKISQIISLDEKGLYAGMVHLHDFVREGII